MKRPIVITVILLFVSAGALAAHDLFLRPATFFAAPDADVVIRMLNGTFTKSENAVTKDRLVDLSVVTPEGRTHPDTAGWRDRGDTSVFSIRTGEAGTYVIGVSTKPRVLRLEAKEFNEYLASDGIPDVLAERKRTGEMDKPSRERYSKHVKALLQVGPHRSETVSTVLGYPAELVALANPYSLRAGGSMRVRALVDGRPVAGQLVLFGGRDASGGRIEARSTRTDADGVARVALSKGGQWYVKFIRMVRVAEDSVDYESKWATLTFEVR